MQSLRMSRCFPQSQGSTICQGIFVILSTESLMLYFLAVYKPCLFDNSQIVANFLQSRATSFFCSLFIRFCGHPWCALYRFSWKGVCNTCDMCFIQTSRQEHMLIWNYLLTIVLLESTNVWGNSFWNLSSMIVLRTCNCSWMDAGQYCRATLRSYVTDNLIFQSFTCVLCCLTSSKSWRMR